MAAVCCCVPCLPGRRPAIYRFIVSLSFIVLSLSLSYYPNILDTILSFVYRTILSNVSIRYPTLVETQLAQHRAALCWALRRHARLRSALERTHFFFARRDLALHTPLDYHELGLFLCEPPGSREPFCVVRTAPCFDNHHTGSKHEHAAST